MFSTSLSAVDLLWSVTNNALSSGANAIWSDRHGSAIVADPSNDRLYWYSSSGQLLETLDNFVGSNDYFVEFAFVSDNNLIVSYQNWSDVSGIRIVERTPEGVSVTSLNGRIPEIEGPAWSGGNYFAVIDGSQLSIYRFPAAESGGEGIRLVPQNAVVIPASLSGNVRVVLESSEDLVEWTEATPGDYNVTTSPRFFRVKAEMAE